MAAQGLVLRTFQRVDDRIGGVLLRTDDRTSAGVFDADVKLDSGVVGWPRVSLLCATTGIHMINLNGILIGRTEPAPLLRVFEESAPDGRVRCA